jgi:hypothetical protein
MRKRSFQKLALHFETLRELEPGSVAGGACSLYCSQGGECDSVHSCSICPQGPLHGPGGGTLSCLCPTGQQFTWCACGTTGGC